MAGASWEGSETAQDLGDARHAAAVPAVVLGPDDGPHLNSFGGLPPICFHMSSAQGKCRNGKCSPSIHIPVTRPEASPCSFQNGVPPEEAAVASALLPSPWRPAPGRAAFSPPSSACSDKHSALRFIRGVELLPPN